MTAERPKIISAGGKSSLRVAFGDLCAPAAVMYALVRLDGNRGCPTLLSSILDTNPWERHPGVSDGLKSSDEHVSLV